MALVLKDRVKEVTTSTGTGTITLAGAATGFQSFSAVGNSNTTYYTIADQAGGNWEVGIGTYTASGTTLSRDTVLSSSNGGALVDFGSGDKDVFVTLPAEEIYVTQPLTYTYTGTLEVEPFVILTAPFPAQSGVTVESQTGVWVSAITLSTLNQQLTSIEFTNLRGLFSSFFVSSMSSLTTLSFPALTTANTALNINNNAALTTLSLPALTTVNSNFGPASMAALTTLSLPALTTVNGAFNPSSMAALTTMSLPALTTVFGNFNPGSLALITTLSLPALITIGGAFTLQAMASLTTISLPSIRSIEGSRTSAGNSIQFVSSTASLSSFTLGSTLKKVGGTAGNVVFTSCALDQASVDNILVRLAVLDGTNGTTSFNNRTVTITGTSATPSATGLAAKATLVARGCTVTNN